jgi:hypothetical protein
MVPSIVVWAKELSAMTLPLLTCVVHERFKIDEEGGVVISQLLGIPIREQRGKEGQPESVSEGRS